ncbi:MAG: hypothetical protein K0S61_2179 [Anaerocolumna sp.]|jgi:hypothetical protein|nr:hypothetical protein [Anaerocolumna sp.]
MKKVIVCKKCSGFDVSELTNLLPLKDYGVSCIGKCSGRDPSLSGKVYGFIKGEFVVCDTKDEFFKLISKLN